MKSKHLRSLLSVLLVLPAFFLGPGSAHADSQELLKLTRMADQLAFDIEENRRLLQIKCATSQRCSVYLEDLAREIRSEGKNLSLGPVVAPLLQELREQLSDEEFEDLLSFYRSDIGRKLVEREAVGRQADFLAQIEQEGAAIYQRQTDERFALLESVDSSADLAPARRLLDGLADRVVSWLEQTAEKNEKLGPEPQTQVPDRSRHAYHQWLAAVLEPLSDEELEVYVEFLESTPGELWMATSRDIRRRSVREASVPVLNRLTQRLGN